MLFGDLFVVLIGLIIYGVCYVGDVIVCGVVVVFIDFVGVVEIVG